MTDTETNDTTTPEPDMSAEPFDDNIRGQLQELCIHAGECPGGRGAILLVVRNSDDVGACAECFGHFLMGHRPEAKPAMEAMLLALDAAKAEVERQLAAIALVSLTVPEPVPDEPS